MGAKITTTSMQIYAGFTPQLHCPGDEEMSTISLDKEFRKLEKTHGLADNCFIHPDQMALQLLLKTPLQHIRFTQT